MKKKTIAFSLIISPLIFFILLVITLIFENTGKRNPVLEDIFTYLLLVSPIFLGIGIYMLIKSKDKGSKFINNKVSKKRKLIGKIILFGLICPVILFYLGSFLYMDFVEKIEDSIRNECNNDRYIRETSQGYKYGDNTQEEEHILEPKLIGEYEYIPDEYTWDFDISNYGYYMQEAYINSPSYYIPKKNYSLEKNWKLKNNYDLDLKCDPIDFRNVPISESYKCSISYNGKFISSDVRHDAFCFWESSKSCTDRVGILLYSNPYSAGSVEYLFLISKNGDIHNKLYAYRLENGKVTLLPFKYEYKGEYFSDTSYTISEAGFDFLGVERYGIYDKMMDGNEALVTFFYEPTMGMYNNINGIYSLWDLEDDGFHLKRTVIELNPRWVSETEEPS